MRRNAARIGLDKNVDDRGGGGATITKVVRDAPVVSRKFDLLMGRRRTTMGSSSTGPTPATLAMRPNARPSTADAGRPVSKSIDRPGPAAPFIGALPNKRHLDELASTAPRWTSATQPAAGRAMDPVRIDAPWPPAIGPTVMSRLLAESSSTGIPQVRISNAEPTMPIGYAASMYYRTMYRGRSNTDSRRDWKSARPRIRRGSETLSVKSAEVQFRSPPTIDLSPPSPPPSPPPTVDTTSVPDDPDRESPSPVDSGFLDGHNSGSDGEMPTRSSPDPTTTPEPSPPSPPSSVEPDDPVRHDDVQPETEKPVVDAESVARHRMLLSVGVNDLVDEGYCRFTDRRMSASVYASTLKPMLPPSLQWRRGSDPPTPTPNMNLVFTHGDQAASFEQTLFRKLPKASEKFSQSHKNYGIELPYKRLKYLVLKDKIAGTHVFPVNELQMFAGPADGQMYVRLLQSYRCYDLMPVSSKLVMFDRELSLRDAFEALIFNGIKSAPVCRTSDDGAQECIGMLTVTDFIRILYKSYFHCPDEMDRLEQHNIRRWRELLRDDIRPIVSIDADQSLLDAACLLHEHSFRRILVTDGPNDMLYMLTHKRLLQFIAVMMEDLPLPDFMRKPIDELGVGTFDEIATVKLTTKLIDALTLFVERRVSSLAVVDDDGRLINAYSKFDIFNLVPGKMYQNLDRTIETALQTEHVNNYEGVYLCRKHDPLASVLKYMIQADVHRLWIVDECGRLEGVVSLSDIIHCLITQEPADDGSCSSDDGHHSSAGSDFGCDNTTRTTPSPVPDDLEQDTSVTQLDQN